MLVTKTPLRISFVGGGSDMESFYKQSEGAVISASINKYVYLTINKKFGGDIRVSYSKTEITNNINSIRHPIVRESLKKCGIDKSIEISSMADVPSKGSGLGSSSAFTVGLLKGLYAYLGKETKNEVIAEKACDIEINQCNEPIGKQDQYGTAIGGLKELRFMKDGDVRVNKCLLTDERIALFKKNLLMLYTGKTRSASEILASQSKILSQNKNKRNVMQEMVNLVNSFRKELTNGDINNLGEILHENWIRKISITDSISNSWINDAYQVGLNNGAMGGKILGAGNGGFFLFFAPPERHASIKSNLSSMKNFEFDFETKGSQLVYKD